MKYNTNINILNTTQEYSFDKIAKQSNGAAWLKCGDTVILATVVADESQIVQEDFLPLTVQYIEKSYAAGKIPGGFFKRETKPSDFETLTSRIIDRSLRPLFPKDFAYPTQITVLVFSAGEQDDLQRLSLSAASAALYVSNIDINRSVSAVRVGKVDGEIVINPTLAQLKNSTLDLYLSGTKDDLLMIEMRSVGGSLDTTHSENAMSEDELIGTLELAQKELFIQNSRYEESFTPFKKEITPTIYRQSGVSESTIELVRENFLEEIKDAINQMAKSERSLALSNLNSKISSLHTHLDTKELQSAIEMVKKEQVRSQILTQGVRADGRKTTQIRPISIETNILPRAHSSALFTRGETQALVVLTMGGVKDAQMYETLTDSSTQNENFMVHYNFPGFSVGEASPITGIKRRELGHGNLAKRALECTVDARGETIRLVSEVLESNGSSSMATVCGGYMALCAAEVETSAPIAGIAMGLVSDANNYSILSDIMGLEDHDGDMDFKVAGSKDGITAMQMDIKLGGISLNILKEALYQAKDGRAHIIDIMLEAQKNIIFNDGVLPSKASFTVDTATIGDIIGQAGKTIREIIEKFEVAIDIDKKDGRVKITGKSKPKVKEAQEYIQKLVSTPKAPKIEFAIGQIYNGVVKKIVDFGAFVGLEDQADGLLHISKISNDRFEKISDVLKEGEEISVRIIEFKGGKISLERA